MPESQTTEEKLAIAKEKKEAADKAFKEGKASEGGRVAATIPC